jgi:hypothetical protein
VCHPQPVDGADLDPTSLRPHTFFTVSNRRPHTLLMTSPEWLHAARTVPSPGVRRRIRPRVSVVAKTIGASRCPFRFETVPRTQVGSAGIALSRQNEIHHEPNYDQQYCSGDVASEIAIKDCRSSLRFDSPMLSLMFVFQDRITRSLCPLQLARSLPQLGVTFRGPSSPSSACDAPNQPLTNIKPTPSRYSTFRLVGLLETRLIRRQWE